MGAFPSLKKNGEMVHYTNSLQRDLLFFLEWDTNVLNYYIRPFTITIADDYGKLHQYTPDFQVTHKTGKQIVECRPMPTQMLGFAPKNIEIGQAWADENDFEFVLIKDQDIRMGPRLANLKLLWRYSRLRVPYEHRLKCRELLERFSEGLSFCSVAGHLADHDNSLIHAPTLYALLFQHVLHTDLDQPLTPRSHLYNR